jgi:hypothetical protein
MELHGHGFQFASCEMTGGHQAMHEMVKYHQNQNQESAQ